MATRSTTTNTLTSKPIMWWPTPPFNDSDWRGELPRNGIYQPSCGRIPAVAPSLRPTGPLPMGALEHRLPDRQHRRRCQQTGRAQHSQRFDGHFDARVPVSRRLLHYPRGHRSGRDEGIPAGGMVVFNDRIRGLTVASARDQLWLDWTT